MATPSEPGWYWWTVGGVHEDAVTCWAYRVGSVVPIEVVLISARPACDPKKLWAVIPTVSSQGMGTTCGYMLDRIGGEWGPRIPGPARLAALEALAATDPLDGERMVCFYCRGDVIDTTVRPMRFKHTPDCLWHLAQERADDAT